MTQSNTLKVKFSNSQLNNLKSGIKNGTEVTLNHSSNLIGNSNDETSFPHKILLTDAQVSKVRKTFANGSSANIKLSKTQLSKMIQSGGVMTGISGMDNFINFPFEMENLYLKELSNIDTKKINRNNLFIDAGLNIIGKKVKEKSGSGVTLTDNEIKDIMKVIKSLENRGILLKGTTRKTTSQEGGFLNFLRPLITAGLPIMKNVLTPLAKIVLIPLGLTAAASATDAAIQKKIFGSDMAALIISNEEMEDTVKKVKLLEKSGLLIKGIDETIKNEAKEQKGGFLPMSLGTLAASILRNSLSGRGVITAVERAITASQNF